MSEEFSFMNEKIKDKPFYKKKWVRITAAVIGISLFSIVISCVVFMKMYAWMEARTEQEAMQNIEIPEDQTEDALQQEPAVPEQTQTTPETIVVENEITLEDYSVLFAQLRGLAKEVRRSVVTVTALSNDVDWFNEDYQNSGHAAGMIIEDNGVELLILTKYTGIEACDGIRVTFTDDTAVAAALKKYDVTTGLAVISVNLSDISEETSAKITKASLGNSMRLEAGTPVMAIGCVDGNGDSLQIGTLTLVDQCQSVVDAEYTILATDMAKNAGADGLLVNLNGEVIGIIQEKYLSENTQNVLTAYGISDIKGLLEQLSNNQDVTYLGIKGISVTEEAQSTGVPAGVYVTEVELDSPAMRGGIQSGDVIQAINGQRIRTMTELSKVLQRLSNKQNISLEGQRLTRDGYKKVNYQTSLSVLE